MMTHSDALIELERIRKALSALSSEWDDDASEDGEWREEAADWAEKAIKSLRTLVCQTCAHPPHEGRVCMTPLYWGSKHDADCGCPDEVCFGEGSPWPSQTEIPGGPRDSIHR